MQGSYSEIKKHVDSIKIIDTHEHLPSEKERLAVPVDVLSQFYLHYTSSDLISAGMPEEEILYIRDTSKPLDERWAVFEPWWEKVRNTGYSRCVEIAARDLYGVDGINKDNYYKLSKKIQERNKPGLYRWVMKEKAGIDVSVLDSLTGSHDVDRDFFVPVLRVSDFVTLINRFELENYAKMLGATVHSFSDLVSLVRNRFERLKDKIVGVKIAQAYRRSLYFEKRSFGEAEEAFNELFKTRTYTRVMIDPLKNYSRMVPDSPGNTELVPMQDYLVHVAIQEAEKRGLPIQIHTGLHEGNENILSNSDPIHLVNLFMEYHDAKFDIFHGSWPYCGTLGALAKNYPNVYLDMSWMHIISPSRARSALSDWLDEVPANKILGFGGDYLMVEGAYGHSVIARENISKVLAEKVDDGDYTVEEAKKYASWMLRENPKRLFSL
ncbi:amidohydrolase [Candidatus Bathyarchaeota archaeon]|nr:amidohydrolase [Candidatus Bathyarchaeota archaeon]